MIYLEQRSGERKEISSMAKEGLLLRTSTKEKEANDHCAGDSRLSYRFHLPG
jgi:hypothetical protein